MAMGVIVSDLLVIQDLTAHYGRAEILSRVSFNVRDCSVTALLGRNGAGKSTTFKSIMGLVGTRQGTMRFADRDISSLPTYQLARMGIGYVPEDRRIFSELSVEENLVVGRQPQRPGVPHWTPDRLFELFPNLADMKRRLGGRMSGGEQQMLTIARTLMGNPRLLLLDEPSEGLAPRIVEQMAEALLKLKREGLAILISEQNLHFAKLIADDAVILERGTVKYTGTLADLLDQRELMRQYLAV